MKKINIFNRNINSPSYRRMPVSGGFNRGGGIPLFSGMTAVIFALFIATPSFAEPTELDKKTVASKAYVDTKQDKIETGNVMFWDAPEGTEGDMYVPGLVAYDSQTNALSGNKIGILDMQTIWGDEGDLWFYSSGGGYGSEMDNFVPTVRAVAEALQNIRASMPSGWTPLVWSNTQSTAINTYNTTFGSGTNNWAGTSTDLINGQFLANSLALKQNKIPAGTTPQGLYTDGSVLTYTNSAGSVGEKHIINGQVWDELIFSETQEWPDGYSTMLVHARDIAQALYYKQNKLPAKSTGNAAPKGNQAVVLNTAGNPLDVYTTAGKDLALTAKSGAQKVMNYIDGTTASATFATSQGLTEAQVKSALVSLELLKDVYSELNSKITNNALPTGTTGTVVTYNGVNAETGVQEFGERAVYDPANAYNAQNDATKLATMASVKYVCAGYEPAAAGQPAHDGTHPGDENYCWLWALPN